MKIYLIDVRKNKKLKIGLFKDLLLVLGLFLLCFNVSCVKSHNENYLEIASRLGRRDAISFCYNDCLNMTVPQKLPTIKLILP